MTGDAFWALLDRLWGTRSVPPRIFRGELGDFPTFLVALAEYLATAPSTEALEARQRWRGLAGRIDATNDGGALVAVALGRAAYERILDDRILIASDPTGGALEGLLADDEPIPSTLPDGRPPSFAARS